MEDRDQDMKYCKLCLVTDVKMFSMNTPSILEAYSQLVQVVAFEDYQMFICYECVSLLRKYQKFRLKCVTALNVLSSIHMDHSKVTTRVVQDIDRNHFKLKSKLACCSILICDSNDRMPSHRDCLVKTERNFIDVDTDIIKIEFDTPAIKLENDGCDSKQDTQINLFDTNEVIPKSNDYDSDNNDYIPDIKKKLNQLSKLKKSKKNATKPSTKISQEQKASKPSAKSLTKAKRKKRKLNREEKLAEEYKNLFKDYATVVFLTPEDAINEMLLRKELNNYKNNPLKCELCYKGYDYQSTYDNHMKKHSPEYGSVECEYCHQRFPTKRKLGKHMTTCHKRKYICNVCPYVCYSGNQATAHMNSHKGKKFKCGECGLTFSRSNTLSSHKHMKHPRDVVCALCGSTFGALKGLEAHHNLSHRQENIELVGPKCVECDVQFATETAWKRHLVLSSKHTVLSSKNTVLSSKQSVLIACEECGETFSTRAALKTHSKGHPRGILYGFKPPAACEICDQWLSTRNVYKSHMTSQHPQSSAAKMIQKKEAEQPQFVCEVCGKAFKIKLLLREHQYKHTGERPYECGECGKAFRQRIVLTQHENTHTHNRIYQCDICQKHYYNKSQLAKHIGAHLGVRPHECTYCHKRFPHKYEVRTHIEHVHRLKPWPKRDRTKRTKEKTIVL